MGVAACAIDQGRIEVVLEAHDEELPDEDALSRYSSAEYQLQRLCSSGWLGEDQSASLLSVPVLAAVKRIG